MSSDPELDDLEEGDFYWYELVGCQVENFRQPLQWGRARRDSRQCAQRQYQQDADSENQGSAGLLLQPGKTDQQGAD